MNDAVWSTNVDFRGFPRPYWQDGDTVIAAFALNPRVDTPTGGYWFDTGFYEPVTARRVPQYRDGQPAGTSARIGPFKVYGQSPPPPSAAPRATFGGGEIALLSAQRANGGVTLRWQALRKPGGDYTAFVHVLDASGNLVAQQDGPPRQGSYPTSWWDAGEVVDDFHPLELAAQPGQQLEIGLYTLPDVRRLPVDGGGSDSVLLPAPTS